MPDHKTLNNLMSFNSENITDVIREIEEGRKQYQVWISETETTFGVYEIFSIIDKEIKMAEIRPMGSKYLVNYGFIPSRDLVNHPQQAQAQALVDWLNRIFSKYSET